MRERGWLRRGWQQVLDDSKCSRTKMPDDLNHTVYLSYEYMPSYLKQCFLYYSLLPKSRIFTMDEVVAMWISEGFIHGNSNDLEELGENYYKELVSRNLIEPDKSYVGIWVCSMHDVVRSFARYITKDEALVAQDGNNDILAKLGSQKFLRLSIETNRSQSGELDWKSLHAQQSVRTLISTIQIKMKHGDSLVTFSSLRTLHIESADMAVLLESLHQLKHLRYLTLVNADISVLPGNIGKMKLLQFLDLHGCENLVNLPDSIVKLGQLRLLSLPEASMVPRGFSGLTNMRRLRMFRAHMDVDWCSLDELGPLSQLRCIGLVSLQNVSDASFATEVRLGEKLYLSIMGLDCTSLLGDDGLVRDEVSEKDQQVIEEVFGELCPPPSIEDIRIRGYFGRRLPRWLMSATTTPLNSLRIIMMKDLACCTQLPDGLCQIPCLEQLHIRRAPAIKHVGSEFVQPYNYHHHAPSQAVDAFPRLHRLVFDGMLEWEEWEWEEEVQAMPVLEELVFNSCKLGRIPPGLATHARSLKILTISRVHCLQSLENFASVVDLRLSNNRDLDMISNFPKLQRLEIYCCQQLESLQEINALQRLVLPGHYDEGQLPMYLQTVKSSHLLLDCCPKVLASMALGKYCPEWDKFNHILHVEAYADDLYEDIEKKWYLFYTSETNSMETNIDLQVIHNVNTLLCYSVILISSC